MGAEDQDLHHSYCRDHGNDRRNSKCLGWGQGQQDPSQRVGTGGAALVLSGFRNLWKEEVVVSIFPWLVTRAAESSEQSM